MPNENGQYRLVERQRAGFAVAFQELKHAVHKLGIVESSSELGDQRS